MNILIGVLFALFLIAGMIMNNIHSKITEILTKNNYDTSKFINEYLRNIKILKILIRKEKSNKNIKRYKLLINKFYIYFYILIFIIILIISYIIFDLS